MRLKHRKPAGLALALLWLSGAGVAAENAPTALPEPLTLEAALQAALADHPALALRTAEVKAAEANRDRSAAVDDLSLDLSLQARRIDPNELAADQSKDDSRALLKLEKTLHDFGRTGNGVKAGERLIEAQTRRLELARTQQRREIMARYFETLEADLRFAEANEAMAVEYVTLDRIRDEHELGKRSDLDLLTAESSYEESRMQRLRAESALRATRQRLALALDRPTQLSRNLRTPQLPGDTNPLPDFAELLKEAERGNLELQALRDELEAQQAARDAAKANRNPRLYLGVEAAQYNRDLASRDPLTAILGLDVPLWQGGRTDALVGEAEAQIARTRAKLRAEEYQLRQALLETWQSIQALQSQLTQAKVLNDYRDLYLDRSRARYELEIKTDLGDSMVAQTQAKRFAARTAFDLALARERLVELTGNPNYSALAPAATPAKSPAQPKESKP